VLGEYVFMWRFLACSLVPSMRMYYCVFRIGGLV
jgi:hypothetical protein